MNEEELIYFNKFSLKLKTKKEYLFVLNELVVYVNKDLSDMLPEDIDDYLNNLNNSPSTKRKKYNQLFSFYNFLEDEIDIPNPLKKVEKPKASKQINKDRTIEFKDMKIFLDTIYNNFSFRDYVITLIIATTGIKISEVLNIKFSDFIIDNNGHIGLRVGRNNYERYVRIFDFVWEQIDRYRLSLGIPDFYVKEDYVVFFSERKLKEYLLNPSAIKPLTSDWLKKVYTKTCNISNLPLITSKDIRHNYTMLSMMLGVPAQDIKDHLGWSTENIIFRYNGVVELLNSPLNEKIEEYYVDLLS